MESLETIINKLTINGSSTELINYLTQNVAEKCSDEIDAAIARASLQCRSISSSLSSGNTNIEKRLMQRRLRSAVNYFENLTKFQKIKEDLLNQIKNCIHHQASTSKNQRPSTGFETLFSIDEFSDDDTLFLTNFSFSQSLRTSKEENLDEVVGIIIERCNDSNQRFEALQKLLNISPLAILRSNVFEILLKNFYIIVADPLLYPGYLSLLANIANVREFDSLCQIFETFQRHHDNILQNEAISDNEKFKFVEVIKQMFECIPSLCRRKPADEIQEIMNIFVNFFYQIHLPDRCNHFLFIYGCIDANASVIEAILHFYNLRRPIDEIWTKFVIDSIAILPKYKKEHCPNFILCFQNNVFSLYQTFLTSLILISCKYLPLEKLKDLKADEFVIWLLNIAFTKTNQKKNENSKIIFFLQNKLKKVSQDQVFADLVLSTLASIEASKIPITLNFAKFLLICLQSSILDPPLLSITVTQMLLKSKQRSSFSIGVQILDKLYSSKFDQNQIETLLTSANTSTIFLQNLNPLNPIHSNILFNSGLSSSKQIWRQFRPRSILNSSGINFIQHYFYLSIEDKIIGLKIITNFLMGENNIPKNDAVFNGLDFINSEIKKIPSVVEILIEMPGILIEIFRNFDLILFFDENFNKSFQTLDGEFLKRFAKLMKNIDFAVECKKLLNFPAKIINRIQQNFSNFQHHKFIIDEFTLGCLEILKASTFGGGENELIDFGITNFQHLKLNHISKGCYKTHRKLSKEQLSTTAISIKTIGSYVNLLEVLKDHQNYELPFLEIIKQKLENYIIENDLIKAYSLTSATSQWLHPIFSYAVYLNKAPSWQFAHRQSILLKIPFYNSDSKDWFVAALFLATNCNAKITSDILSYLCSSSTDIRAFWPSSHESIKEFVDYLGSEIWPEIFEKFKNSKKKPRFGTFVDFVYRCGIGSMDFRNIEEYLLMIIWGGKKEVVINYFVSYWKNIAK